jgi:hypothetical protein
LAVDQFHERVFLIVRTFRLVVETRSTDPQ